MSHFAITITYSCRVHNGSAYADYDGRTDYRVIEDEWSGPAALTALEELLTPGSGRQITGISSIVIARHEAYLDE